MAKVWGVIQHRNEYDKAVLIASYHLNYLKFDGIVIIDNDSTAPYQEVSDKRVLHYRTEGMGLQQANIKNNMSRWLFQNTDVDMIYQIDCDMMYHFKLSQDELLTKYPKGFSIKNVGFLNTELYTVNMYNFWKKLDYRNREYYCPKGVITREGFNNGYELTEGDHYIIIPSNGGYYASDTPLIDETEAIIYEYRCYSYEDFVRKTVTSAIGQLVAYGYAWISGEISNGKHVQDLMNTLSTTGSIRKEYNDCLWETLDSDYLNKTYVEDRTMWDVEFEIIK